MSRVVITGGSGKLGQACIRELLDYGYEVINVDKVPAREPLCHFLRVDLTDYGQVFETLADIDGTNLAADAVVHLAAIVPGAATSAHLFHNNAVCSFNVFWAAHKANIKNIVWASSEALQGVPFSNPPPYVPIDEDYPPLPETAYALNKLVEENIAQQICRWDAELKMIGLRFSYIKEPTEYAEFEQVRNNPNLQTWNLWSYVDVRDCARAVRLALGYSAKGFDTFLIAASDSIMNEPNEELLRKYFPNVPHKRALAPHESLVSCERAKRLLGYQAHFSWRDEGSTA